MTSTSSSTAARQTGVQNPLLLKMGERALRRISSLGKNIVISLKSASFCVVYDMWVRFDLPGVLTNRAGLLPPSISSFFRMEIFLTPDYTLTRNRGGVSKLRRILLCLCK